MENEHEPAQTPPADSALETAADQEHESPPAAEQVPATEHAPLLPLSRETGPAFYAVLAALLFFISYSIAFIVGNDRKIHIDFVFAETDVSLIWTVLLLLAVGLVGGLLLSQLYRHQRSKQSRKA